MRIIEYNDNDYYWYIYDTYVTKIRL